MNPLLTSKDVAKILNISPQGCYNLAKAGKIKSVTFSSGITSPKRKETSAVKNTVRFKMDDVLAFIEENTRSGGGR